jgi:hypothetical protein
MDFLSGRRSLSTDLSRIDSVPGTTREGPMSEAGVYTPEQVRDWLCAAAAETGQEWAGDSDESWDDARASLLAKLQVQSANDDPSLLLFVEHVDALDREQQRELLGDEGKLFELISTCVEAAHPAADAPAQGEPVWDETSRRWLTWDPEAQQWTPMEGGAQVADPSQGVEPVWDESSQRWLAWDPAAAEWIPTESETAATQSDEDAARNADEARAVHDAVIAQLIAEHPEFKQELDSNPDLAAQLLAYATEQFS